MYMYKSYPLCISLCFLANRLALGCSICSSNPLKYTDLCILYFNHAVLLLLHTCITCYSMQRERERMSERRRVSVHVQVLSFMH